MMKDFDWQILSTLYVTKNITRTAEILFTRQPNITKRVKAMENEFGFAIITRTASGVRFTSQGEILAERAVEIDQKIREVHAQVHEIFAESKGTIRMAAPNSFVRTELPSILEQYRMKHIYVTFQLLTCLSDDIPRLVKSGEIDVGFSHMDWENAPHKYLYGTEAMFVVSRDAVDLASLPQLPQIDYTRSVFTRKKINQWWEERYEDPQRTILTVNNGDICREVVSRGLGYGFFFGTRYLSGAEKLQRQVAVGKTGVPLTRNTWMLCSESGYHRRIVREFMDFIEHEYVLKNEISLDV